MPVEEVLRRDRDGWVEGFGPWVCRGQRGRNAQIPQDTPDSGREIAQDGRVQRRCATADSIGASHSSREAAEKQSKRSKKPRSLTPWVHFQESCCAKLRDSCKELIIVCKDFMKASVSNFNLADKARHRRIFFICERTDGSIRTAIFSWKMHISASSKQKISTRLCVPDLK